MNIHLETCDDLGSIKPHSWEHAKNKRLYALLHEHEAKFVKENIYIKPSNIRSKLNITIRKWYVSNALKCKVSYLRRQVSYLLRHLLTLWLTTQGVNIISAAYM